MANYKYENAKKMSDNLQKEQRLESLLYQPLLDQLFPFGVPGNTATPNRPSSNRTIQNRSPVNRPIQI